jgi:carbon storage regulator
MLVLLRRKDECITIGDNIIIKIIDVSGKQVKIGIEAPREIAVLRDNAKKKYREETKNEIY